MYEYNAELVRVIDGDTYVLDVDLGFYVHAVQHVRLLGIDCPEKNTPQGVAAALFATNWFALADNQVRLSTTARQEKSFDRWIGVITADVTRAEGPADLARALRANGHFKAVEQLG
jgi:endonuclease YncB( thermonuclease family)